jgi:hypothetical protein
MKKPASDGFLLILLMFGFFALTSESFHFSRRIFRLKQSIHDFQLKNSDQLVEDSILKDKFSIYSIENKNKEVKKLPLQSNDESLEQNQLSIFSKTTDFLIRASLVGILTGFSVVIFKSSIAYGQRVLYEGLADFLPKPPLYWPLALCKLLHSFIRLYSYTFTYF